MAGKSIAYLLNEDFIFYDLKKKNEIERNHVEIARSMSP